MTTRNGLTRNGFVKIAHKETAHGAFNGVNNISEDEIRNVDLFDAFAHKEDVNGYKTIAPKEKVHGVSENFPVISEDKIRKINLFDAFAHKEDANGYKTIDSGEDDNVKGVREATMHRDNSYTR